jgi:hypothetical protein
MRRIEEKRPNITKYKNKLKVIARVATGYIIFPFFTVLPLIASLILSQKSMTSLF